MGKELYRSIFIILLFIAGGILLLGKTSSQVSPEIQKIKTLADTAKQSEELLKLLDRVGPVIAQDQMVASGLPFTGQTHLLIHTIGNYIYDKYGLEGLPLCRDYFLSACYHAFIIDTLADYGLAGMKDVMERCTAAGPGVAPQCAHAAGHGFVAWHNYDLVKGAQMCDTLGGEVQDFAYFNCYNGVFMENVWGVHNGTPSKDRWVSETDIYYPCTDPRIPEKYLAGCWSNQATLIYQHYKGDLEKTALACEAVENEVYRDTCYENLSRQIHPLTQGRKEKVVSLCSIGTSAQRRDNCILTNMSAYFSVGDRVLPEQICNMTKGELKDRCFERLNSMIKYYGE